MYIPEFWCGVISTILVEIFGTIVLTFLICRKQYEREVFKMKQIINIERADEATIKKLIEMGIIYIGDDDMLHVVEK